jgi:hypothetical protein
MPMRVSRVSIKKNLDEVKFAQFVCFLLDRGRWPGRLKCGLETWELNRVHCTIGTSSGK